MNTTYGDTLTLACSPGVEWLVQDVRAIENAGDPFEVRARVRPVRFNGAEVHRFDPVPIGRSERTGLEVSIRRASDDERDGYTFWASCDGELTARMRQAIDSEIDAHRFILPVLTDDEIRSRMLAIGKYAGERAAREVESAMPDRFSSVSQRGSGRGRARITAAMGQEQWSAFLEAAVTAFREEAAKRIATY